jgi:hypothetical protein
VAEVAVKWIFQVGTKHPLPHCVSAVGEWVDLTGGVGACSLRIYGYVLHFSPDSHDRISNNMKRRSLRIKICRGIKKAVSYTTPTPVAGRSLADAISVKLKSLSLTGLGRDLSFLLRLVMSCQNFDEKFLFLLTPSARFA